MTTLKICVFDKTHWITDIESIIEARSFSVPKEVTHPAEPRTDEEAHEQGKLHDAAVVGAAGSIMARCVHVANFVGASTGVGKLLYVKTHDGRDEAWIVPADQSFLMSDSGQTIDRI